MDRTENSHTKQNMSDREGKYHTFSHSCVLKHIYK